MRVVTFSRVTFLIVVGLVQAFLFCQERGDANKGVRVHSGTSLSRRFDAGRKWAIVVGVNEYLDPSIPNLRFCVADAQLMARTLADKCGYGPERILTITDEQQNKHLLPFGFNLREQIRSWLLKARQGDTVLVYFAGHGFLGERGQKFLAPMDCKKENLGLTAFRADDLRDMLHQCTASQKILILDCCHAGGARSGDAIGPSAQELGQAFAQAEGLITLASCRKTELSHEWMEQQHGLFTHFLAEGLAGAADTKTDGMVDSDEIYQYTLDKVVTTAQRRLNVQQTPVRLIGEDVVGVFPLARVAQRFKPIPLSGAARKLLQQVRVERPVRIEAFVGELVPASYEPIKKQLLFVLEEIRGIDADKFEVRIHSVRRFGREALVARQQFEIDEHQVATTTGGGVRMENVLLGVAVRHGLDIVVTPFFGRGLSPEYELTRSIMTVTQVKRQRIGIVNTDARVLGGLDLLRMQHTPPWPFVDELKKQYEIEDVDPNQPFSESEFAALIIVQPSALTDPQLDELLAAIRHGVPCLIFEDPCPAFDTRIAATSSPRPPITPPGFAPRPSPPKADISRLWNLLEVQHSHDQIVWQDYNPYRDRMETLPEYVFVDEGSGAEAPFSPRHPVTADLQHVLMLFPGFVVPAEDDDDGFVPLLQTGSLTGITRYQDLVSANPFGGVQRNGDPQRTSTAEAYSLAVHIRRRLDADRRQMNVVLVTDLDLIAPAFFQLRERGADGETLEFDNVSLVLNAVDTLTGDDRFVALRRRRTKLPILDRDPAEFRRMRQLAERRRQIEQAFRRAVESHRLRHERSVRAVRDRMRRDALSPRDMKVRVAMVETVGRRRLDRRTAELTRMRDRAVAEVRKMAHQPHDLESLPDVRFSLPETLADELLFPDFREPQSAASLEIVHEDPSSGLRRLALVRGPGGWTIASHGDFPVENAAGFANAIAELIDLPVLDLVDDQDRYHELYGVEDPERTRQRDGAGLRVTVNDDGGRQLLSLIVGKQVPWREQLRYVRRADEDRVFVADINIENFGARLSDWADTDVFPMETALDISAVGVRSYRLERQQDSSTSCRFVPQEEFTLEFDRATWSWKLRELKGVRNERLAAEKLAAGERLDNSRLSNLRAALEDLRFVEVQRMAVSIPDAVQLGKLEQANPNGWRAALDQWREFGIHVVRRDGKLVLAGSAGEMSVVARDGVRWKLYFGEPTHAEDLRLADQKADTRIYRHVVIVVDFDSSVFSPFELDERGSPHNEIEERERQEIEKRQQQMMQAPQRVAEIAGRYANWCFLISEDDYKQIHLNRFQITQVAEDRGK